MNLTWLLARPFTAFFLLLLTLAVLFAALGFYVHFRVQSAARNRIVSVTAMDKIPRRQVAVVLGARVYKNGQPSAVLRDRLDAAIELYRAGKVEKILMSGDNRTAHYNEVTAMRNYALGAGIPPEDVVRDFAGFRTFDSMYRAKELWGLDQFLVVSQRFHLPRALYIARHLGVDATGVASREIIYRTTPKLVLRERFAWLLAWFDVNLDRMPHHLGEKESLDGTAQKTRVAE